MPFFVVPLNCPTSGTSPRGATTGTKYAIHILEINFHYYKKQWGPLDGPEHVPLMVQLVGQINGTTRQRQKRQCCSYFLNKAGSLVTMKSWSSPNRKWKISSSSGKYHSFTKSLPKRRNANRILCTARIKYAFVVSLLRTV